MATLTYAQLEGLWITNGGNKAVAPLAAAIAMAESSGRTDVTSANPDGGVNVGLWQLDTKGKGAGHTVADLQNPATNAAVAVQGSNDGTDWSAWETFVTGAYKRFMNAGTTPDLAVPGGGQAAVTAAQQQASAGPDCAFSIGGQHIGILFGHGPTLPSACLISKTEVRAILGGLIMVAGGLVMMPGLVIVMAYGFKATGAAATAAKVAPYLGPYGKAVGTVAKGAGRGAQRGGRVAGRGAGAAGRGVGRGAGAAGRAAGRRAAGRAETEPIVTDPAAGV
jgi:Lysozyme like domain